MLAPGAPFSAPAPGPRRRLSNRPGRQDRLCLPRGVRLQVFHTKKAPLLRERGNHTGPAGQRRIGYRTGFSGTAPGEIGENAPGRIGWGRKIRPHSGARQPWKDTFLRRPGPALPPIAGRYPDNGRWRIWSSCRWHVAPAWPGRWASSAGYPGVVPAARGRGSLPVALGKADCSRYPGWIFPG